ncbi:MAG: cytochrome P450 [Gammaproteobacteria bacterium]|nr:MAG: cytochrome P450 [Gammaproteobacteria bacterium]RLA26814.1 MAG: cytochrome P450 [Gammaproteobacteria bacterium]
MMSDLAYHKVDVEKVDAPSGCPVDDEFSPYVERYIANPYAWLELKRENEPVFYSEQLGYLVVTRMEDVEEIFMNAEVFSSTNVQDPVFPICKEAAEILSADDYNPVAVMSNRPQPDHTRIRKYTQAGFSPRRMKVLEPIVRKRAEDLVDKMILQGAPVEWVSAVGNPLPAETIFRLIGFPEKDDEQLKAWTNNRLAFTWGKTSNEEQVEVAENLLAYWRYVAAYVEMRRDNPADDFTSELLAAHAENPDDLSYVEVQSVIYGLSFAGHEIVRNVISNALLCVLGERENWERLCNDPTLIKGAIEEVLRFNSAQTSWRRITTCDTEFRGVKLPKGTQVFMSLAASNRDPRRFDNPDRYDMDRANANKHIAFGRGPHICLGRLLARLELTIVLEILVAKLPSLRLVIGQDLSYLPNFSFRGPSTLYLTWD